MSSPLAGAEMMHFLCAAAVDVGARLGGIGEEPGRLDHDVDAQVAPGKFAGIALGEDPIARPSIDIVASLALTSPR